MSRTLLSPTLLLAALSLILVATASNAPAHESETPDTSGWEIRPLASGELEPLDIRFMVRGTFHAKSAFRDRKALGGFGRSDNEPRRLGHDLPRGRLLLIARPEQPVALEGKYEGLEVILANTTGGTAWLAAANSRLPIVREALDTDGHWRPIEYLPRSWCGNSYHRVALPRNHYWSFDAPRYTGSQATLMRFALEVEGRDRPVFSNEFAGNLNPEQFLVKQGHTPTGIMDPYLD